MIALLCFLVTLFASPLKSRSRLEAENAALRYQLIVLRRKVTGRVRVTNGDRMHQSRGQFSGSETSRQMRSSGACIANMSEFEFLVHTGMPCALQDILRCNWHVRRGQKRTCLAVIIRIPYGLPCWHRHRSIGHGSTKYAVAATSGFF